MEPHIGAKFQKNPALGYGDTQDRPDGRTDGRTGLNFKVKSLLRRGTKNWDDYYKVGFNSCLYKNRVMTGKCI